MAEPAPLVRAARLDDAEAMARLLVQVQEQHVRDYPSVFRAMPIAVAAELSAADIAAGICAVAEGEVLIHWSRGERFRVARAAGRA